MKQTKVASRWAMLSKDDKWVLVMEALKRYRVRLRVESMEMDWHNGKKEKDIDS